MSGLDTQQSAELPPEAKDVTLPGAPESKTVSIEACEEFGGVPLLFQPVLNRGECKLSRHVALSMKLSLSLISRCPSAAGTNFSHEERKQHQ